MSSDRDALILLRKNLALMAQELGVAEFIPFPNPRANYLYNIAENRGSNLSEPQLDTIARTQEYGWNILIRMFASKARNSSVALLHIKERT